MSHPSLAVGFLASRAVLAVCVPILVVFLVRYLVQRTRSLPFPVAKGVIQNGDYMAMMMSAINKYPEQPFIIPFRVPAVILPFSMLDFVKDLREDQASLRADTYHRMQGRYTGLGTAHPELIGAIRDELTRGISRTLADLQDEVVYAYDREIGTPEEWKEMYVYGALVQVVALISGRIFVGLPLSRDKRWVDATINYTTDAMEALKAMDDLPWWIRDLVAPFNPKLQKLLAYRKFAADLLSPQVTAILQDRKERGNEKQGVYTTTRDADDEEDLEKNQFNMIQWVINHYKNLADATPLNLGDEQMLVSFAAIHTTTMQTCYALFDLAAHPQYIPELRKEINDVIFEEDYADRKLRKTSMPKLKKLDSFLKESQRMSPPGLLTLTRCVPDPKGITLPNGDHLPCGTSFAMTHPFYSQVINPAKTLLTGDSQPPLNEFHPFRYSNLRAIPGEENKHQFVTTGAEQLAFGHGHNACPGRFFASNEIKIALVELLKRYDVALGPNGEGPGESNGEGGVYTRPRNLAAGVTLFPDPLAKIYLRARKETS